MANLFGTNPNQVPLNSMLGNLAFQDKAYVSVDKVGIGSTFVDSGTSGQILQVYGGGAYISGSIGIGSTNPTTKLDVQGGNGFIRIGEVFGSYNGITLNNSTAVNNYNILSSPSDQHLYLNRPTGWEIRFRLANNDQMVLNSSGNLGINSSSPTSRLDVIGDAKVSGVVTATSFSGNASSATSVIGGIGSITQLQVTGISTFTNGPVIIGAATSTGTASQRLQVTGGGYVSGNLGVGVTNPSSRIDAYSPTSASTAIRATSGPSFSSYLFPGVISGLSTTGSGFPNFAASGIGATSGEIGVYSFFPTFANFPADLGPRRAVDLVGGFSTGVWGTEYFSINVGRNGASNDSSILTSEKLRITASGNVGIGTTNPVGQLQVSSGPVIIGAATSTGTASQPLQVSGGGYFAGVGISTGSIGVGITRPQGAIDIRTSPQWSSFNYGANLVIGGSRNNGIGILDSTNSNPWAIVNSAGTLVVAAAPDLGNTATFPIHTIFNIQRNGNVLIGSATSTGTTSQPLQVTGGAYVSGNLGVGVTAPSFTADIAGDARVTSTNKMRFGGTAGTTNFYIQYNSTANSLDFVAG